MESSMEVHPKKLKIGLPYKMLIPFPNIYNWNLGEIVAISCSLQHYSVTKRWKKPSVHS